MSLRQLPEIRNFDDLRDLDVVVPPAAFERWQPEAVANEAGADNVISIYEPIGEDPWTGAGFTQKRAAAALRAIGPRDVVVNINSPGGLMFDGIGIYDTLRSHPAKVTVRVVSLAASAGSIITMAGDEIQIAKAGFLMMHNAQILASGDRHDLRDVAAHLEAFDQALASIYADRTGIAQTQIAKMLDKETWLNGQQAVDQKFADSLLPADQVGSKATAALEMAPVLAARQLDVALARQGVPRARRREMLREFKTGTPSAAAAATPSAGDPTALAAAMQRCIETLTRK